MNKIIICAFNLCEKRIELLKVCIYSICVNTSLKILIYYDNISQFVIDEILSKLPSINFIKFELKINKSLEIASQKMYMWSQIVLNTEDNENIILSDLDTLYIKDPSDAFEYEFDIGFTAKDDPNMKYPLNTGIVFIKINERSRTFVKYWLSHTVMILEDNELSKEAIDTFGGADQKALAVLMKKEKNLFGEIEIDLAKLYGFPASRYNIHKDWSNPYGGGSMIHYKGGWKDILINEYKNLDDILKSQRDSVKKAFMDWKESFLLWRKYRDKYYSI